MNSFILYGLAFFVLCIIVGIFASSRNRSGLGWFLISLLLSPILGFILVAVLGPVAKETPVVKGPKTRPCPLCAEQVLFEAIRCKHCQSDIPPPVVVEETFEEKVKRYGIYRDSGQYIYGPYRYQTIEEAVVAADKTNSDI